MADEAIPPPLPSYDVDVVFPGGKLDQAKEQLRELMAERALAGWRLVSAAPMPISAGLAAIAQANLWLFWSRA